MSKPILASDIIALKGAEFLKETIEKDKNSFTEGRRNADLINWLLCVCILNNATFVNIPTYQEINDYFNDLYREFIERYPLKKKEMDKYKDLYSVIEYVAYNYSLLPDSLLEDKIVGIFYEVD